MLSPVPPEHAGFDASRLHHAFSLLQGWLDAGTATAVAAVVVRHGKLAGSFYRGTVSPAPGAPPVTADSLFHTSSIGKPMTALAVMLLVEAGAIALDDPVAAILPEFAGDGRDAITIRQLLAHTSGLPQDPDRSGLPPGIDTPAELRTYLRAQLVARPGSKVEYSNVGYGLLGLIIEAVSGQPFPAYLRERVFAPLGMRNSFLAPAEDLYPRIVHVGGTLDAGSSTERFNSTHARRQTHPAGNVIATALDVARFFQLFLDGGVADGRRVIAPATAHLMTSNQTAGLRGGIEGFMTWDDCAWGLGFDLRGSKRPHFSGELSSPATFGHTGVAGTFAWADPARNLVCVMLANRTLFNLWNTSRWSRFSTALAAALSD